MYYCCKGCTKCCNKLCKFCGSCCNAICDCFDGCCKIWCQCCENCCENFGKCIANCFNRPFSFCLFLTFFICGAPIILGIIGLVNSQNFSCGQPIKVHVILMMIIYAVNLAFVGYLCYRYGTPYTEEDRARGKREELNVLQRTQNLLLYDFVVCFYILFVIFEIVWLILGSVWKNSLTANDPCTINNTLITMQSIMIGIGWGYLATGLITFMVVLIIHACDEGSCTIWDTCRCLFLCCTCGLCDIGKSKKLKNQQSNQNASYDRVYYSQNRQQYTRKRSDWISKGKNILHSFGWSKTNKNEQPPVQNAGVIIIPPNQNGNLVTMAQPLQQNQMYNPQPIVIQQSSDQSIIYQQPMIYQQQQPMVYQQQPMVYQQQQPLVYQQANIQYAPNAEQQQIPEKQSIFTKAKNFFKKK